MCVCVCVFACLCGWVSAHTPLPICPLAPSKTRLYLGRAETRLRHGSTSDSLTSPAPRTARPCMVCSKFNAASGHNSKAAAMARGWDHGRPGTPGGGAFGYAITNWFMHPTCTASTIPRNYRLDGLPSTSSLFTQDAPKSQFKVQIVCFGLRFLVSPFRVWSSAHYTCYRHRLRQS